MGKHTRRVMADVREFYGDTLREAAIDLDQRIVLKTPVDTGRARANWLVGLNKPRRETKASGDSTGQQTIAQNTSTILGADDFQDIWISNNLPYIEELENGSSQQAPTGMVRLAVNEMLRVFRNR